MGYDDQSSPSLLLAGESPPKVLIFDWDDTICPSSFVDQFQVERFKDLPVHVSDWNDRSPMLSHYFSYFTNSYINVGTIAVVETGPAKL
jgi:hypothetical protein